MSNVVEMFGQPLGAVERAKAAITMIASSGANLHASWIAYGRAYADLRAEYGDNDKAFGKAVSTNELGCIHLPNGGKVEIKADVRLAAEWAANCPDELATAMLQWPDIEPTFKGGFRGLHAKVLQMKKPVATPTPTPAPPRNPPVQTPTPCPTPAPAPMPPQAGPDEVPPQANPEIITVDEEPDETSNNAKNHVLYMNIGHDYYVNNFTRTDCVEKYGCANGTADTAIAYYDGYVRARADVKIEAVTLTKSDQKAVERAVNKEIRDLRAAVEVQVRDEWNATKEKYFAKLEADIKAANARLDERKRIPGFVSGDYHKLMKVLHPDQRANLTDADYTDAMEVISRLKPFMTTQAELSMVLKRRDAFKEAFAAGRAKREAMVAARKTKRKGL